MLCQKQRNACEEYCISRPLGICTIILGVHQELIGIQRLLVVRKCQPPLGLSVSTPVTGLLSPGSLFFHLLFFFVDLSEKKSSSSV